MSSAMIEIAKDSNSRRTPRAGHSMRSGPGYRGLFAVAILGTAALIVFAAPVRAQDVSATNSPGDCISFGACESRILELRQAGESAAALALFETLPDTERTESARLMYARLLLDRDRLREAAAIYEDLCGAVRSHGCWNALGVVRMSLGGYREAAAAFEKSIRVEGTARTHSNLAVALSYLRKANEARENHDRALALDPRGVQTRLNFGVFLFSGRRFDEAGKIFAEVIADAPDEFYARLYLGRVHTMQRDYEKALSEFNRGVELNRKFFDLYYHRAVVRAKLRDPGGALSDLNQADRINPVNGLTDALRNSIKSGRN
jgi:tetratricopeptide (TPR) repeat protein